MPPLGSTFYQLFAAAFGILMTMHIKVLYCLGHFIYFYLIWYSIWTYNNTTISLAISWDYAYRWSCNYPTLFGEVVTNRTRHCQTRLPYMLAPNTHRTDLFAGNLRLKLIQNSIRFLNTLSFPRLVRLMIYRNLFPDKLFRLPTDLLKLAHVRTIFFPYNKNRRVTSIGDYKIVFLDKNDSASAPTKMSEILLTRGCQNEISVFQIPRVRWHLI